MPLAPQAERTGPWKWLGLPGLGCENCGVVFLLWVLSPTHPGGRKGRGKPGEGPEGAWGFGKRGCPTWVELLEETGGACIPPGLTTTASQPPHPARTLRACPCGHAGVCVSGAVLECDSLVPRPLAIVGCVELCSLLPWGSWCRGGLKTRAWRPYQTTGFPEEGRVGVGLRDGAPPLGVPGQVEGARALPSWGEDNFSPGDPSLRPSPVKDKQTPRWRGPKPGLKSQEPWGPTP